jgi:type I restriction enzyme R subunit
MSFNENTRVKIPAILTLTRLGYDYLSLKNQKWDEKTNIFPDIFFAALQRLNPAVEYGELEKLFLKIQTILDNDDLGREFYDLLISGSEMKLIDFENFANNTLNVVTELPCMNEDDEFRPDITLLINGLPLVFIEVKKPNNREGIIAERDRINKRFKNKKFRRFINILQLLLFSNNMEYEPEDTDPIQGAFYSTVSKDKAFFNQFKEEHKAGLFGLLKNEDMAVEDFVLKDTNNPTIKYSKEFLTNKHPDTPTNRIILALLEPERFNNILRYGFAYVEYADKEGRRHLEKHIMRYPQFFASLAIQKKLTAGVKKGIIWHTQGSGKTALAYFNVKWLTEYFQKQQIIPKFYFIVDRIDLRDQAIREFTMRGLRINRIDSKEEFIRDLQMTSTLTGDSGQQEITVLNIQKFSEESKASVTKDYDINTQRVYFIDEAHRSYNPKGSFLANLMQSDPNAIVISLTGTPLLGKGEARLSSTSVFGDYIHKYYYNQSIADGYTLRLIREDIENKYKLKLKEVFEQIEVPEGDTRIKYVYAHKNFCTPLLEYVLEDLRSSRIRCNDDTIGGLVVCHSSEQAELLYRLFTEQRQNKTKDTHMPNTAALILHDADDKKTRKANIEDFKDGKIDLLFVFNMLLTGFDAPRLKKLYLGRVIKEHNLLQALTRVNRPYRDFRYGYVVDFADIRQAFDKTNKAYWKELQSDWGKDIKGYTQLFKSQEEIDRELADIKNKLWIYDTTNAEEFQRQISAIQDKNTLLDIRKALQSAKELYNLIRYFGYAELLSKLDFQQFKRLFDEVDNRIALLNQREALKSGVDIIGLLNEALEDTVFVFRKRGEEKLDLLANDFTEKLGQVRRKLSETIDKGDPLWISLVDELNRLFKDKNLEEMNAEDMESGLRILHAIYAKVSELNRQEQQLLVKYANDPKYVRIHKTLTRENSLTIAEQKLFVVLKTIKEITDEELLLSDLLNNESYFDSFVLQQVAKQFETNKINLNPATAKLVKHNIVREYENEWDGVAV